MRIYSSIVQQLMLTHSGEVLPIPTVSSGFPGWLALGEAPIAGVNQSDRTGLSDTSKIEIKLMFFEIYFLIKDIFI